MATTGRRVLLFSPITRAKPIFNTGSHPLVSWFTRSPSIWCPFCNCCRCHQMLRHYWPNLVGVAVLLISNAGYSTCQDKHSLTLWTPDILTVDIDRNTNGKAPVLSKTLNRTTQITTQMISNSLELRQPHQDQLHYLTLIDKTLYESEDFLEVSVNQAKEPPNVTSVERFGIDLLQTMNVL